MRKSIRMKLGFGFGCCVLLMAAIVGFNFSALQKFKALYQESTKRDLDMDAAIDAVHIGEHLYRVITDTLIKGDLPKRRAEWATGKEESLTKLGKVAAAADTPDELTWAKEAKEALDEIISIFEQEMLPLLAAGGARPVVVHEMSDRIDSRIRTINLALQRTANSMSLESLEAERTFRDRLTKVTAFGLIFSLLGLAAAIFVSMRTSREIVGPLSEMTRAAHELQMGNYQVDVRHVSADEVGFLADAFRDMSQQVRKHTLDLQQSNEQLSREIAERMQAEEELQKARQELEQRVEERTAELARANERLQLIITEHVRSGEELRSSREQLRNLSARLESLREEERTRLSREIHDELGQALTALKLDVSWLGKRLPGEQPVLLEKTRTMASLIEHITQTVQRISSELRPRMLDDLGLIAAIEWGAKEFAQRTGIVCACTFDPADMTVDLESSTAIFRIFQETLTNVSRHAEASRVDVRLEEKEGGLMLVVKDNGRGISEKESSDPRSLGLIGIRERTHLLGGEVEISGIPHGGTVVKVTIPRERKGAKSDKYPYRG